MMCVICEDAKAGKIPYSVTHFRPDYCASLYHVIALDSGMACPRCGFHEMKMVPNG